MIAGAIGSSSGFAQPPAHSGIGGTVLPRAVPPAARRVWAARQSALCLSAIAEAEQKYGIPHGMLGAISRVESGRPMPVTGDWQPWPWTVNDGGHSLFFDTRAEAAAVTAKLLAQGGGNVDIGCMQVNLRYHRSAFRSLQEAFDPMLNADYAARLLVLLHHGRGWEAASGLYHSATPALGTPYSGNVSATRRTQRNTLANARASGGR
jgi:hypothetical protein